MVPVAVTVPFSTFSRSQFEFRFRRESQFRFPQILHSSVSPKAEGNQYNSFTDSRHVAFVIVSQPEAYHASVAARLQQDIVDQVQLTEKRSPTVFMSHVDFSVPGAWTIAPLLAPLLKRVGDAVRWALFVEAHTAVRCSQLFSALDAADKNPHAAWIGYPLRDDEPTIIHHFALFEELDEHGGFVYPYFASGVAMRTELMSKIVNEIESGKKLLEGDFSIDPAFELARLVHAIKEPMLTPDLSFCVISADECATYPRHYDTCGSAIPEESIFFAVKTWSGFHSTRVKVVKKTWGKLVTNLLFFSDVAGEGTVADDNVTAIEYMDDDENEIVTDEIMKSLKCIRVGKVAGKGKHAQEWRRSSGKPVVPTL
ncbi:Beta-1,3-glucosyltransferase [Eumeta japonica]|uniref:Beta-1,3-glucosyltransferase n=1 Tax=Eumeta variegata TaxID=151549 RepID=A0A4C1TT46_EUMVA|nr:Beta-1,3-glucosyltransferase [Eumeta japonica]